MWESNDSGTGTSIRKSICPRDLNSCSQDIIVSIKATGNSAAPKIITLKEGNIVIACETDQNNDIVMSVFSDPAT